MSQPSSSTRLQALRTTTAKHYPRFHFQIDHGSFADDQMETVANAPCVLDRLVTSHNLDRSRGIDIRLGHQQYQGVAGAIPRFVKVRP